jgi:L-threonylcarbamoyladenylate synthase
VIKVLERGGRLRYSGGSLRDVLSVLEGGELVVYPTDTVYGLAADPFNPLAVDRLYEVKRRPKDQPISIAVATVEEARRLAHFNAAAEYLWQHFMPGPLTILLKPREEAPGPPLTAGGLLGLRMPGHPVVEVLTKSFGPLTATSANRHGGRSPRDVAEAAAELGTDSKLYLDAGPCPLGVESTVVDASGGKVIVKRRGALDSSEMVGHG